MKRLPIVFACDNHYAMPFGITLQSLLFSKKEDTIYDIYCLVPDDFSNENLSKIKQIEDQYTNFSLTYKNLGDAFENVKMAINHISYVTYFRLLLPELLPEYEKCLYLDVDVIVKDDLLQLLQIDLQDNYIGAVIHPQMLNRNIIGNYKTEKGGYFNAGMLLMNLELMRKDNKQKEFLTLMKNNFPIQDQDILNVACSGRVKYLPLKYNMMIRLCELSERHKARSIYPDTYDQAKARPVIIHYANKEKPWNYKNLYFQKDFDEIYKVSPFFDNIKYKNRMKISKIRLVSKLSIVQIKRILLRNKVIFNLNELRKKGK